MTPIDELVLLLMMAVNKQELKLGQEENEDPKKNSVWLSKFGSALVKSKATLVICPASLLSQWEGEVKKRLKQDVLKVLVYHGTNRGKSAKS